MGFWEKIKGFFNKKSNNNSSLDNEWELISKIRKEIEDETFSVLTKWEDVPLLECMHRHSNNKKLLIADDNGEVARVVKSTIESMLNKKFSSKISFETISMVDKISLAPKDLDVIAVTDELAPYRIIKSCKIDECFCKLDYAVVDIMFGTFVIKDEKKIYYDGIDVVHFLHQINPNIKTCLFTGCSVGSEFSKEREKIIELLGEDYLKNNVLVKTTYLEERVKFFAKALFL